MKNILVQILFIALSLAVFTNCEDVILVDTDPAAELITVDGWINNQSVPQTIRLTRSQPYFQSQFNPGVVGASVIVESSKLMGGKSAAPTFRYYLTTRLVARSFCRKRFNLEEVK